MMVLIIKQMSAITGEQLMNDSQEGKLFTMACCLAFKAISTIASHLWLIAALISWLGQKTPDTFSLMPDSYQWPPNEIIFFEFSSKFAGAKQAAFRAKAIVESSTFAWRVFGLRLLVKVPRSLRIPCLSTM